MTKDYYSKEERREYNRWYHENLSTRKKMEYRYNRRKKYHDDPETAERLRTLSRDRARRKRREAVAAHKGAATA